MTCVALIPARGGSTRIPRKNIKPFMGKPMIGYAIEAAFESTLFDRVIVSTEDREIAEVAASFDAELNMRPAELARNEVGTQEVMAWTLRDIKATKDDIACCIYPCVPMLTGQVLIDACMSLINDVRIIRYVVPVATWLRDPGQFYFGRTESFMLGHPLVGAWTKMLPIDPATECDINTPEDWAMAERMFMSLRRTNPYLSNMTDSELKEAIRVSSESSSAIERD
jgi:N-acylneuraminate cytidylyltransferase